MQVFASKLESLTVEPAGPGPQAEEHAKLVATLDVGTRLTLVIFGEQSALASLLRQVAAFDGKPVVLTIVPEDPTQQDQGARPHWTRPGGGE